MHHAWFLTMGRNQPTNQAQSQRPKQQQYTNHFKSHNFNDGRGACNSYKSIRKTRKTTENLFDYNCPRKIFLEHLKTSAVLQYADMLLIFTSIQSCGGTGCSGTCPSRETSQNDWVCPSKQICQLKYAFKQLMLCCWRFSSHKHSKSTKKRGPLPLQLAPLQVQAVPPDKSRIDSRLPGFLCKEAPGYGK